MESAPPGGDRGEALKLWVVLSKAFEAIERHAADDVRGHGLTLPEFGILEVLYHKGPVLLGELQKRVLVSSGGTTFLVDRLEGKGLVERRPSPDDRRARFVALTPAGAGLIARIFPVHADRILIATSGLSGEERAQATELLRKLGLAAEAAFTPERPEVG